MTAPPETTVEPVANLLVRARAARLRIRLTIGDRVQVSGPLLPEVRQEIRERQGDIVAALRDEAARLEELHRVGSMRPRMGRFGRARFITLPQWRFGRGRADE